MNNNKKTDIGYKSIAVGYFLMVMCTTFFLIKGWITTSKPPLEPLIISLSGVGGYLISIVVLAVKYTNRA